MDKITVHTPHGDVEYHTECEVFEINSGKYVQGVLIEINKRETGEQYVVFDTKEQRRVVSDAIRPVQKPKPLEGLDQAEKFNELGLKGWWYREGENSEYEWPMSGSVRVQRDLKYNKNTIEVAIGGNYCPDMMIRPPRSTEWIRACDVTEETGR